MAGEILPTLAPQEKMPPPSRQWLANAVGRAYYAIKDESVKSAVTAAWWPKGTAYDEALHETVAAGCESEMPDAENYDTDAESAPDLDVSDDELVDGADAPGETEAKKGIWGMCRVVKKEVKSTQGRGAKKQVIVEHKE
eukprot:gene2641-6569_t